MGKVSGFLEFKRDKQPYRPVEERLRDWRQVMARNLVHGHRDGEGAAETPIVVGANARD